MVAVVDHLMCHTAVNADILARDKTRHVRAEIEHHIGNIGRISDPARRLLHGVRAFVNGIVIVDPSGRDGIDPHLAGKRPKVRA